jgi:hypothetical protein
VNAVEKVDDELREENKRNAEKDGYLRLHYDYLKVMADEMK